MARTDRRRSGGGLSDIEQPHGLMIVVSDAGPLRCKAEVNAVDGASLCYQQGLDNFLRATGGFEVPKKLA